MPYATGIWDASTGRLRHTIDAQAIAASPRCELILAMHDDDDQMKLRMLAQDGTERWARDVPFETVATFVDDTRVVVGRPRVAELLDGDGKVLTTRRLARHVDAIHVVGDTLLLLGRAGASQRITVARAADLHVLGEHAMKPIVALAADGKTALARHGDTGNDSLAAYDTSDFFAAPKKKRASKTAHANAKAKPAAKPATRPAAKVNQWFFAVPSSVSERQLLAAGADVHHMLDDPLHDFCIVVQPTEQVRALRWFAFVARRRRTGYELAPWIDTLADLAPLLVSVCHDGRVVNAAAYRDHRRKVAATGTPAALLAQVAPGEPADHYLTTLDGRAYLYAHRGVRVPKPVTPAFTSKLRSQIAFHEPF